MHIITVFLFAVAATAAAIPVDNNNIAVATKYLPPTEEKSGQDFSGVASDYLPPVEEAATQAAEVAAVIVKAAEEDTDAPQESAILTNDGYQYKTVRRLMYRQRRDVSEIANEYLPPVEAAADEAAKVADVIVRAANEEAETPQNAAVLADDGYQYKTVRRLKYRQRRDVSEIANEYLPPVEEAADEAAEVADITVKAANEEAEAPQDSAILAGDGYQYKTVRRLKYKQRRDVSEIADEYLPPVEEVATEAAEVAAVIIKAAEEETDATQDSAVLADDGYQYKTMRRLKYRQRRDVSEIANEYLPPVEEVATEAAEIADVVVKSANEEAEALQDSAVLADDGYQYKTVRRLKYRQRRDVSEIANEYLPPFEEAATEAAEIADVVVKSANEEAEALQESAILADDGYQYKTVRRLKYKQRRDVSEIADEYLPPVEEVATEAAEVTAVIIKAAEEETDATQDSAVLADDGYQYKTMRRLKYRQRRDVSEIANEYLPPVEEVATEAAEIADVVVKSANEEAEALQDSAVLADDGYQYKTVRRLKYRQRRDVSEIANEYLPPVEESANQAAEVAAVIVEAAEEDTDAPQESAILADDGYQYKTVRRLKYRQRRDVSELASEYLPPVEEAATETAEVADIIVRAANKEAEAPQESAILAADGYQYKTVHRLKYRQRRDVSEIANEYLPPAVEAAIEAAEVSDVIVKTANEEAEVPQESAILADDGYQYKTVRRLKYRQRRDVSEIANEYLPPVEEAATEAAEIADVVVKSANEEAEALQDSAVLADDGYQYKTVRRLKYRQRRDVSEIAAPAVLDVPVPHSYLAPDETATLSRDGYHYRTVKRLKF